MANRFLGSLLALTAMAGTPLWAAAAEHGAAESADVAKAVNPLDFVWQTGTWTAVVFLLLLAVLWKYAWRPIAEGLDKREKRIADDIAAAEQANEEARQLLAQHRARLDGAEAEVREMIAQCPTRRRTGRTRVDRQGPGGDRGGKTARTAGNRCGHVRRLKELADRSAALAVDLAGKIIQSRLDPAAHSRLIEQAVAQFVPSNGRN